MSGKITERTKLICIDCGGSLYRVSVHDTVRFGGKAFTLNYEIIGCKKCGVVDMREAGDAKQPYDNRL
jgi:hypothetical protein